MKTTYTILAILTTILCTQTVSAKLGTHYPMFQHENKIEVNVEAEIRDNINKMLANIEAPIIKTDVAKQVDFGTIKLQINKLEQNTVENQRTFKVIIAD